MATTKSGDEVRADFVEKLGRERGLFFYALRNQLIWLHAIALLNGRAPFFFRVVQVVLWDDVLLHIARLTDPPKVPPRCPVHGSAGPEFVSHPRIMRRYHLSESGIRTGTKGDGA